MDNATLIMVCAYFGGMGSFFWLLHSAMFKEYRVVSCIWAICNAFIGIGFYLYTYRLEDKFNYILGFPGSDFSLMFALFLAQIGVLHFFKRSKRLSCFLFALISTIQIAVRLLGYDYLSVVIISAYMAHTCWFLSGYIFYHLKLQNTIFRIYIVIPMMISGCLMLARLAVLFIHPEVYLVNLMVSPSAFNSFVILAVLMSFICLNGTVVGVIISNLLMNIEKLTNVDTLTKIYNRRYFYHLIEKKFDKTKDYSVMILDIDHFKKINDTYGHDTGDECLIQFTRIISETIENIKNSYLFRLGGEEFCVMTHTQDRQLLEHYAEIIQNNLAAYNWPIEGSLTASIGVSYQSGRTVLELLREADAALYEAKRGGRNRIEFQHI